MTLSEVRRAAHRALTIASAVLLAACAQNFYGAPDEATAVASLSVAAGDLHGVRLHSRQGPIEVAAGHPDSLRVTVQVGPAPGPVGTRRACTLDPATLAVAATVTEGVLTLSTGPTLGSECVASWILHVAPRLAADLEVEAGNVTVEGVAGGVAVSSRAGRTRIRASAGPIDVRAGSGNVELAYSGGGFGAVSARTDVGRVDLQLEGRRLARERSPGSGDAVELEGEEQNSIRIRVSVGNIALRLGEGA